MAIVCTLTRETKKKKAAVKEEMQNGGNTTVIAYSEAAKRVETYIVEHPVVSADSEQQSILYEDNSMPHMEGKRRSYKVKCEKAEARFKAQKDPNYIPKECEHCVESCEMDYTDFCTHRRKWLKSMECDSHNGHDLRISRVKQERRSTSEETTMFNVRDYKDILGFDDLSIFKTPDEINGCIEYMETN